MNLIDQSQAKEGMKHHQIGTTDDGQHWICACGHHSRNLDEVAEHYVAKGMRDPRK
jgi:hypothetical protein